MYCTRHRAHYFTCVIAFGYHNNPIRDTPTVPILQIQKLRLRKVSVTSPKACSGIQIQVRLALLATGYCISGVERVRQSMSICAKMSINLPECKYGVCSLKGLIFIGWRMQWYW